ncbi:MAG: glycerophosphodiester phosphodiesterase [Frankiales bacterium]|nr:glycerophosphodiester phosphodiesterase [Frankiales bacterium]
MTVLAIAHRAGNDLEALTSATELGAHVLETDVHRSRGRLEVRHSKALGPLPLLYDEGRFTRRPVSPLLLHEVLDAVRAGQSLMLDLKGPGAVGLHVAEAVHSRVPDVPVLVCSRHWAGVDDVWHRPWARPVLSARNATELRRLRRRVRGPRAPYGVSLHRSLLDPGVVAELQERVELVMSWPINDLTALDDVLARGVRGVISDERDVLKAVLELPSARRP